MNGSEDYNAGRNAQRLEDLEKRVDGFMDAHTKLIERIDKLIPAVAKLEVKAGVWGSIGGLMAALVVISIALFKM